MYARSGRIARVLCGKSQNKFRSFETSSGLRRVYRWLRQRLKLLSYSFNIVQCITPCAFDRLKVIPRCGCDVGKVLLQHTLWKCSKNTETLYFCFTAVLTQKVRHHVIIKGSAFYSAAKTQIVAGICGSHCFQQIVVVLLRIPYLPSMLRRTLCPFSNVKGSSRKQRACDNVSTSWDHFLIPFCNFENNGSIT